MKILTSDKAPFVLGLLVTIIGWHVSQFVAEITKTQAVSYNLQVDRETRDVVASIRNVSRTKSLVNATFSIACANGENCLVPLYPPEAEAEPVYGGIRSFAPNSVHPEPRRNSARSIAFRATIAAGGRFAIVGRLARPDARAEFFFIPDQQRPLDIYIYDRNTVMGFLVENYLLILLVSFLFFTIALMYSILFGLRSNREEWIDAAARREERANGG